MTSVAHRTFVLLSVAALLFGSCPAGAAAAVAPGQRLAEIINQRDSAAFAALIDAPALSARVAEGLKLSSSDRAEFELGFKKGLEQLATSSMAQFEHKHAIARLVKSIPTARGSDQIIRVELRTPQDEADGYDYLQFEFNRAGRVVDWSSHAQGARTSDLMRRVIATMITDDSVLASLFGINRVDTQVQAVMEEFGRQMRAYDYAGAHATLDRMPDGFKSSVAWATLRVTMAANLGEDIYRASLQHLADRHGDRPQLQFLLIDHYHYRGEQQKVLATVQAFERAVVEDGVTNLLKCGSAHQAGDAVAAIGHCERSLALEPEAKDTWWMLVSLALEQRDAPRVLDTLSRYEQQFTMQFDPAKLLQVDGYAWLATQPAFDAWAAARRDPTTDSDADVTAGPDANIKR